MSNSDCKPCTPESPVGRFDGPGEDHTYCPYCDYDLTGAPTNRCPECGNEFDRERLARWATDKDLPLLLEKGEPPDGLFRCLLRVSLFAPTRLGREMPPHPRVSDARRFGLAVRAIVLSCVVGLLTVNHGEVGAMGGLVLGLGIVAGSYACEFALSLVFTALVPVRGMGGKADFRFWNTLTSCFTGYLLILMIAIPVGVLLDVGVGLPMFTVAAPGGVLVWWWYALGQAVWTRGAVRSRRTLAILAIPVVGVVAIILGFLPALVLLEE